MLTGNVCTEGEVCSDIKMHGVGHKKEGELGRKEQVFHQQLPGGQLGAWACPRHPAGSPLCLEQVSTLLGLGTSTSPAMWGDHRAGPPDLSWGPVPMWTPAPGGQEHVPQVEKEKIRRWWCHGEAGPISPRGVSAEGLCEMPITIAGSESRGRGGWCYMAVVITFSSGSTVFS